MQTATRSMLANRRSLLALAAAGLMILSCRQESGDAPPSLTESPLDHQHHLAVEWIAVGNVAELAQKSDLVVRGKTVAVRYDVMRNYPWNAQANREMTAEEAGGVYHDSPVTIFTVAIDDVVRSSANAVTTSGVRAAAKGTIEIVQPGGRVADGCIVAPEETPIPSVGQEAVLFLSAAAGTRPLESRSTTGTYFVVGGYQGHVTVSGGTIKSPAVGRRSAAFMDGYDGKPAAEFVDAIRRL